MGDQLLITLVVSALGIIQALSLWVLTDLRNRVARLEIRAMRGINGS